MIDGFALGELTIAELTEQSDALREIIADPAQLRRNPTAPDTLKAMQDELSVRAKRNA